MSTFSPAPTAPLLIMVVLPHYGVCSAAQRTEAACRESCPVLLLLSALAVRSTGVVLAVGQPEVSSYVQRSAVPEPLSIVLTPTVALLILKVILVFFFHGGY